MTAGDPYPVYYNKTGLQSNTETRIDFSAAGYSDAYKTNASVQVPACLNLIAIRF